MYSYKESWERKAGSVSCHVALKGFPDWCTARFTIERPFKPFPSHGERENWQMPDVGWCVPIAHVTPKLARAYGHLLAHVARLAWEEYRRLAEGGHYRGERYTPRAPSMLQG